MPGPVDALGYRRPPASVAYDDLRRQGLPPVLFAHTYLPEGVTICDVRGFAALIEQAHHDRALLTLPDGEDGAVLCRGFPNNGLAEWRIVTPNPPAYTWPLRIAAERDGHHLCTFLPVSPADGEPAATPPVTFTIRAEGGGDSDVGAVPFGPMNGMGYRRPPATVAFADLRRRGLPEVVLTHLSLPEGAIACDLEAFAAMIEDAYRTPGVLHVHPDLDADGNEQCIGIGAERSWRWEMARRPEPAPDGDYYGGLHHWVARLLLAPERDGARQGTIVPSGGGARGSADPGPVTFTIRGRPEAGDVGAALSRLDGDAPAAAALSRALAFLGPEPLPFSLLLAAPRATNPLVGKGAAAEAPAVPLPEAAAALAVLLGDPIASGDAIQWLRRRGLVAWLAATARSFPRRYGPPSAPVWRRQATGSRPPPPSSTPPCRPTRATPRPGPPTRPCCRTPAPSSPPPATPWAGWRATSSRAATTGEPATCGPSLRMPAPSLAAPNTPVRWSPAASAPAAPGRRATRSLPGTRSPPCSRWPRTSSVPMRSTPSPPGMIWPR